MALRYSQLPTAKIKVITACGPRSRTGPVGAGAAVSAFVLAHSTVLYRGFFAELNIRGWQNRGFPPDT